MTSRQVPIIGQFYADESRPWSSQDCCNYIPVQAEAEGALTQWRLRDAPGVKPFVNIGSNGPIRGARNVEGKLLVVAGTQLYEISNKGVAIPRGTVPGVGPVQMSHNQQSSGNQVMIVNGVAGYIYNTATLAFDRITDTGFPGAISVDFIDGYFTYVEPAGRYWGHSDLADGLSYNTLDENQAEASPDRIVTHKVSADEVVIFGQRTIQFFVNNPSGDGTNPFDDKGIVIDQGCAGTNAVVLLDNTLMWLDDHGIFQRMNGYTAQPISNRVIERAISNYDWASVVAYTYEDKGHKIAYWTFRDGITLGYDVTTGKWHRRASFGLNRWRMTCIVQWNRKWYAGDFQKGRLWELDWDYKLDGTDPLIRRYVSAPIWNEQRRLSIPSAEMVFDTGGPVTVAGSFPAQPIGPTLTGDAPAGYVGKAYTFQYTGTAGTNPIAAYSNFSGALPTGLTLNATGALSGTPTAQGTFTFAPRVTDTAGLYAQISDSVLVYAAALGFEWQYTGRFGIQASDVTFGDGKFLAVTQGTTGDGQVFTSTNGSGWVQKNDGAPTTGWPYTSCAYGLVAGVPTFVVSRGFNNVIVSNDTETWTQHATASGDAYNVTLHDGTNFIRAGFSNSAEYSANGKAWTSAPRPSANVARIGLVADHAGAKVVLMFCDGGAIHRSTNSGVSWTAIVPASDPNAGGNFGGAASDGTTIRAYKYGASILTTYTSTDGGATFTARQDNVGADNYQGGKVVHKNGNWFALGRATTSSTETPKLWYSPNGLVPWTQAPVQDYVAANSTTFSAIVTTETRAVVIGNQATAVGNEGFAMTSPVIVP